MESLLRRIVLGLFALLALSILALAHCYLAQRLVVAAQLSPGLERALLVAMGVLGASLSC